MKTVTSIATLTYEKTDNPTPRYVARRIVMILREYYSNHVTHINYEHLLIDYDNLARELKSKMYEKEVTLWWYVDLVANETKLSYNEPYEMFSGEDSALRIVVNHDSQTIRITEEMYRETN